MQTQNVVSVERKSHQKTIDKLVIITVLLAVLFLVLIGFQTNAFAQQESEMRQQAGNAIDQFLEWVFGSVDESTKDLSVPDNPINLTDEEARSVIDSAKDTGGAGIKFMREAHHLAEDTSRAILPWDVNPDIIFLLGLIVIGVIAVKRHKTIVKDLAYIIIGIVVLAVIFIILRLNLS